MKADCRKCVYFIPLKEMPIDLIEKANEWLEKNRPGKQLLGWCRKFHRPVTYFTGSCWAFTPRQLKQLTLTNYARR